MFTPEQAAHASATQVRANLYDVIQSGAAASSVADIRTLSTTKVNIPDDHFSLTSALRVHSVSMDLFLGVDHPFTKMYRNCLTFEWGRLEQGLHSYVDQVYQGDTASAYTRFGRWIALSVNTYLSELSQLGRYLHGGAALPELAWFATLIALRENPFPQLPAK